MRTFIVTTFTLAAVLVGAEAAGAEEVHCAAYSQQCGYSDAPAAGPIIYDPAPAKCAKKKYRKAHKARCAR